jgi:hypothetical protein
LDRADATGWVCFALQPLGCNDVSLPLHWRTVASLESIIGVLMCGIFVSLLFATVTRLIGRQATAAQLAGGARHAGALSVKSTLQTKQQQDRQIGATASLPVLDNSVGTLLGISVSYLIVFAGALAYITSVSLLVRLTDLLAHAGVAEQD